MKLFRKILNLNEAVTYCNSHVLLLGDVNYSNTDWPNWCEPLDIADDAVVKFKKK